LDRTALEPLDDNVEQSLMEIDGRFVPFPRRTISVCGASRGTWSTTAPRKRALSSRRWPRSKERLGKPEEAVAHYLEAVALYRARDQPTGVAKAVSGLARLERLMGRSEMARTYYLDAASSTAVIL